MSELRQHQARRRGARAEHPLIQLLRERPLVFDGATGSNLERLNLTPDDFDGHEGCYEVLVRTRPDAVQSLHHQYFAAGCDVVETDSFGGNRLVLEEYGLGAETLSLNRRAAQLAREVASGYTSPQRPRFVAGSIGPGTKLPSLGHVSFDELTLAYREQVAGLLDGGVDLLSIETCQDLLQIRAVLHAVRQEFSRRGAGVPVMVCLTVELSGSLLLGTDLGAALAVLLPLSPDILGLNCATGPLEMKQHLRFLSRHCPLPLAAQPNAGLPENVGGRPVYSLSPGEFARWLEGFIVEDGVQIVGGCCGTTPAHLAALVERVSGLTPAPRTVEPDPCLASLYGSVSLRQEPRPFLVGERTNANGSRRFRELLQRDLFDDLVELARDQERGGAHALDLSTAFVGRDECRDMRECVTRLTRQVRLPLFIDSTQPEVMEQALKLAGGRSALNSINLEEGETKARAVLSLARDFGAAVVALAIDEQGMARSLEHKLAVADRLHRLATEEFGLRPQDLILDMLTFTVASGEESLRDAARQTLEAVREVKQRLPGVLTILGVSNVSFGLRPAARRVLNSVFLHLAVDYGLDLAIVDASKILPLSRIEPELSARAEDLLLDRRAGSGADPLRVFIECFAGRADEEERVASESSASLPERLGRCIIDGDRGPLELLLSAALTRHTSLEIVNQMLIPAMQRVGDLFGVGQMQLPFVLQSAEVMKQAVGFLESSLAGGDGGTGSASGQSKETSSAAAGTLVLATVRGDVHDVGKNLVEILLSNSGYRVLNLGIKVPIEEMIRVWQEERADAIGMSGLLVKSTQVMRENLEELKRRGLNPPVLLGGAALSRRFVEHDLRALYGEKVYYARDGFEALEILRRLRSTAPREATRTDLAAPSVEAPSADLSGAVSTTAACSLAPALVPNPPFLGNRLLELPAEQLLDLLDEGALFRGQWRYLRGQLDAASYARLIEEEARPALIRLKQLVLAEGLLRPRAVYGYYRCYSSGDALLIVDETGAAELLRLPFPRQRRAPHRAIPDFFRAQPEAEDVVGLLVTTIGPELSARTAKLFEEHRYRDYLELHGLGVVCAEAAAEYVHRHIRRELELDGADRPEGVRGARFSFGYPACPDLEQQRGLFGLLRPERIGVSLTETAQMVPEQSVSALLIHHPAARPFVP